MFRKVRESVVRKCNRRTELHIRAVFEKQPFGELERWSPRRCWMWSRGLAQQELENESWLRTVAELGGRSYQEMRVIVLEFLDTDILQVSSENCVSFLDPLIDSWDIDLATFALDIALTDRVASGNVKRFEFVEVESPPPAKSPGSRDSFRIRPSAARRPRRKSTF